MKNWRIPLSLAALLGLLCLGASTGEMATETVTKQNGGSTGDSVTAAADTSRWVLIDAKATTMRVVSMGDSTTHITVQVAAPGDTLHWMTIDDDTTTGGTAEATTDFGSTWAGFKVRVIQDMIPSGGAAYGRAIVAQRK